jgi:hypothetical protein
MPALPPFVTPAPPVLFVPDVPPFVAPAPPVVFVPAAPPLMVAPALPPVTTAPVPPAATSSNGGSPEQPPSNEDENAHTKPNAEAIRQRSSRMSETLRPRTAMSHHSVTRTGTRMF